MPMFDIQDSKDVHLEGNKTNSAHFLRASGVKNLTAVQNEAVDSGVPEAPRRWGWFRDNIAVQVIATLLAILVLGIVISLWPEVKKFMA